MDYVWQESFYRIEKSRTVSEIWLRENGTYGPVFGYLYGIFCKKWVSKWPLGKFFSSKNGLNGLVFGLWVDMDQIEKITEGIWDFLIFSHFMDLFDSKFCLFFDFSQNFDLLRAIKPQKIKKSNPFCNFQDITHIYSLAKN